MIPQAAGEAAAETADVAVYFRDGTMAMKHHRLDDGTRDQLLLLGGVEEGGCQASNPNPRLEFSLWLSLCADDLGKTVDLRRKALPADLERIRVAEEQLVSIARGQRELIKTAVECQDDTARYARFVLSFFSFSSSLPRVFNLLRGARAEESCPRASL